MVTRYFLVVLGTSVAVAGASLLWPKVTSRPRPETLGKVHDLVIKTDLGQRAAQILGVEDESVEPVNVVSVASQFASTAIAGVVEKVQEAAVSQAMSALVNQYEQLPSEQKKELEQLICRGGQTQ